MAKKMGVFTKYTIDGNDLVLTEEMYWEFEPHPIDSITEWHLHNVDRLSLDKQKLEVLISGGEEADTTEEPLNDKKRLSIFPQFEEDEYHFVCDNISTVVRPFNALELTDIVMRKERLNEEQNATISKQNLTVFEIARFLENEIDKKKRILAQTTDKTSRAFVKSQDQLDTLIQLKYIVNSR